MCRGDPIQIWSHTRVTNEFELVSQFARALLTIPYSSASVERSFSDFKTIKTNKRNSLCLESLEACLLIFQTSKTEKLIISEDMMHRYQTLWSSTSRDNDDRIMIDEQPRIAVLEDQKIEEEFENIIEKEDPMIIEGTQMEIL